MMENTLSEFLDQHRDPKQPLLLALSGGPDSLALFYLLLKHKPFSVIHIDHGWREESAEEAEQLKKICATHGIEFFLKKLNPSQLIGNLENASRNARLSFYREILNQGYQAIILGHHADDQAETALKRLFEGSSLFNLGAMQKVSDYEGMPLWRPLLGISKKKIINWLTTQKIPYFTDATNSDTKFLRARMRQKLIPQLEEHFGKNISTSLAKVAAEASELQGYFEDKFKDYDQYIFTEEEGIRFDLSSVFPTDSFELKLLVKRFLKKANLSFSQTQLKTLQGLLEDNQSDKWIEKKLYVHRRTLFIPKQKSEILTITS